MPKQSYAQALDWLAAVVQQVQARVRAVAGETGDHDVAAVNPQQPLFIGQLAPRHGRELARIGGGRAWIVRRAEADVQIQAWIGSGDDSEQQIAAREKV